MSLQPKYENLHDFSVDLLNYIEKKFGAGEARKFVDQKLKDNHLLNYYGSTQDGKIIINSQLDKNFAPNYDTLFSLIKQGLIYTEQLKGFGTGGVKDEVDKMLAKHNLLEYFGSTKDGKLPQ